MASALKILAFLLVAAIGAFVTPFLAQIGLASGFIPTDAGNPLTRQLIFWLGGGGWWVWIVCALAALLFFFIESRLRLLFLSLPFIGPLLYGLGVLFFFQGG
ncbi:MAG: hypothetical protein KDJ15_06155 [Alphaproteobacteria bacterium]|nr:hypothetical protein [Alphaproteobacteria bacterium]